MELQRREVAKRVFAYELSRSTFSKSEGGEKSPKYVITPTGAKCNRVFMVGVLLDKEEVSPDSNFWKLRISDPTGVINAFVGRYQTDALEKLSTIDIPSMVSVTAKLNIFEGETAKFLSLRPEEINLSTTKMRDYWVIETAKQTIDRIRRIVNEEGEEYKLAREIYNTNISEYVEMVKKAVSVVLEEAEVFSDRSEVKEPKLKEEKLEEGLEELEEIDEAVDIDEFEFEEEEWDLSDILKEE